MACGFRRLFGHSCSWSGVSNNRSSNWWIGCRIDSWRRDRQGSAGGLSSRNIRRNSSCDTHRHRINRSRRNRGRRVRGTDSGSSGCYHRDRSNHTQLLRSDSGSHWRPSRRSNSKIAAAQEHSIFQSYDCVCNRDIYNYELVLSYFR